MNLTLPELIERLRERRDIDIAKAKRLWEDCTPRDYHGMIDGTEGWKYDSDNLRYIRPNGKVLSAEELRKVVHNYVQCVERKLRIVAGAGNYTKSKKWFIPLFLKFLGPFFLSMGLLAVGGEKLWTAADSQILSSDSEYGMPYAIEHLVAFADEIDAGRYDGKDGQVAARAASYSSGPWLLFSELRKVHAVAAGMKYEKNILDEGVDFHCHTDTHGHNAKAVGCVNETKRGWVPIGSLARIGNRKCLWNCRCSIQYAKER